MTQRKATTLVFSFFFLLLTGFLIRDYLLQSVIPTNNTVIGQSTHNYEDIFSNEDAYQIGRNTEGNPIFVNTDQAFSHMLLEYSDTLAFIQHTYHLLPISHFYWRDYPIYANNITSDQPYFTNIGKLISFFDIYSNSFESPI